MSTNSDSEKLTRILGITGSIIAILAFFGITNYDELKEFASPSSADPSAETGTDGGGGDYVDVEIDPEPGTEQDTSALKDLSEVAVGDCIQPVTPLRVVSCGDDAAEYMVLARLPFDTTAVQRHPYVETYEAAICLDAGWDATNSAGSYAIYVYDVYEVLCVNYL